MATPIKQEIEKIRRAGNGLMDPEFALRIFEFDWDAKLVVNEHAEIMFVNNQAEIMFGYPRNEMYDKPVTMLVPEDVRVVHEAHLSMYLKEPRVRPMGGFRGQHKSGRGFEAMIYLVPIQWHEGLLVVATIKNK